MAGRDTRLPQRRLPPGCWRNGETESDPEALRTAILYCLVRRTSLHDDIQAAVLSTRPSHHCRTKKVRPLLRLCARPLIVLLSTLAYRLPSSFLPSTPVLFDSPFTPLCQSWQVTNQRSPPRQTYRPSCQLSTRCVRPPTTHVNAALTTDFPVLQLPILYVVRLSISPTDIHKPLIDPPHPSPTDRRLRRCHLRCVEHTSCQEPHQPI